MPTLADLADFLKSVGFPIALVIYLLVRGESIAMQFLDAIHLNTNALHQLKDTNAQAAQELKDTNARALADIKDTMRELHLRR